MNKKLENALPLFDFVSVKRNEVINNIIALDFEKARRGLYELNKGYPSLDTKELNEIVALFCNNYRGGEPQVMFSTWKLFANLKMKIPWYEKFERAYFLAICKAIEATNSTQWQMDGIPVPMFYLKAGKLVEARRGFEKLIVQRPADAKIYAYLADTHFLEGRTTEAALCYREAFELSPEVIDITHIKDRRVIALMEEVNTLVADSYMWWVISYGCVEEVFPYKTIKLLEDLRAYVDEFITLQKEYRKAVTPCLSAKLFYKCIVLSHNNSHLRHIKTVELSIVRALMKEINPQLFHKYMYTKEQKEK
ncbi:MAG: hypothetical protein L3V56_13630 [Candidatus Magnetoovum sp. WYHC-5]|nr:hypothetical protein [Candidatus Magnetoovum sp. WYHC-5]